MIHRPVQNTKNGGAGTWVRSCFPVLFNGCRTLNIPQLCYITGKVTASCMIEWPCCATMHCISCLRAVTGLGTLYPSPKSCSQIREQQQAFTQLGGLLPIPSASCFLCQPPFSPTSGIKHKTKGSRRGLRLAFTVVILLHSYGIG